MRDRLLDSTFFSLKFLILLRKLLIINNSILFLTKDDFFLSLTFLFCFENIKFDCSVCCYYLEKTENSHFPIKIANFCNFIIKNRTCRVIIKGIVSLDWHENMNSSCFPPTFEFSKSFFLLIFPSKCF